MKLRILFPAIVLVLAALGCNKAPDGKVADVLEKGQQFNDAVQEGVYGKSKLAPTYSDKELTPESGFRVNGKESGTPKIDTAAWRLHVEGLVAKPGDYTIDQIKSIQKQVENVRHVCVEGWSMKVKWGGTPLWMFLDGIGADSNAKYLLVECADGYYSPLDMASSRHPQTLLCYEAYGKPLTAEHGAPLRIVCPTKLGYKSAKWITKITVTNIKPGGYWEDQGYDWFGGI